MTAPDLKPCPFCGGEAEIWRAHRGLTAWIACMGRCAVLVSKEYTADEEAIAAWNTRAPLAEALAVQTWQPIETVPKDGTRVDLWSRNGRRICNCDPTAYDLRLITHWTPLPEPPATPAGHWKDACRESNGPEICDEPCSKCLRAIGERADG